MDRLPKLGHDKVPAALLQTCLILTLGLEAACLEGFLVVACGTGTASVAWLLGLLGFLLLLASLLSLLATLALLELLDDILHFGGKIISLHIRDDGGIILCVGEVKIVHVGDLVTNTALLALDKHVDVPLPEPIVAGSLLVLGLSVEDVVVTLERWASPDVGSREAFVADIVEVGDENLVVDVGTHPPRPHVVDAIQVRHIDRAGIGRRIFLVVLVDVEAEEHSVNTIQVLEDDNTLTAEVELIRIVLEGVAFLHSLADIQAAVHGSDLTDSDMATKGNILLGLLHRDVLCIWGRRSMQEGKVCVFERSQAE